MDSFSDREEHEPSAKRIKLHLSESNTRVLCKAYGFSSNSSSVGTPIDASKDLNIQHDPSNCDSSTPGSVQSALHDTSPHADVHDEFSNGNSVQETSDNLDLSHDSLEIDDNASTVSHLSDLTGLSDLSGQEWKPMAGSMLWIQKQMQSGVDPRMLLTQIGAPIDQIPDLDDITLWKLIINMLAEPPRRHKLRHVNTLDDVVRLFKGAQNIIVLTGAGVSVSCGIPDFRSRDGIYSRLAVDYPDLPDPQAMFDINYFSQDPRPFYKFAKDIYPGKFEPSPCHRFIKLLEKHGKLLRNYTQNIDTLEKVAHIEKVVECHGSFATATCTKCGHQVTSDVIRDTVLAQKIPLCEKCHPVDNKEVNPDIALYKYYPENLKLLVSSGIMKPDIVFFGEGLSAVFHETILEDKNKCDLLLVIGSSLKVRPVALIPSSLPANVPQILINREPLPQCNFDVELLGDCDVIINHLCQLLGKPWEETIYNHEVLKETLHLLPLQETSDTECRDIEAQVSHTTDSVNSSNVKENVQASSQSSLDEETSDDNKSRVCMFRVCRNSSSLEKNCKCGVVSDKQMSIISKQSSLAISDDEIVNSGDSKCTKERHMSVDSTRDSGIGENSNFTDFDIIKYDTPDEITESNDETTGSTPKRIQKGEIRDSLLENETNDSDRFKSNSNFNAQSESESDSNSHSPNTSINSVSTSESNNIDCTTVDQTTNLRGYWQPKIKRSLADRLPKKCFYAIPPSRYVFPGAEIFYDPDEKYKYFDDTSSSDSSDSDSETENDNADSSY